MENPDYMLQEKFDHHECCVIVPSYNNAATLGKVLDDILQYTRNIIVVNDGSTDHTRDILKKYERIVLLDYAKNKGKGYALRMGFGKALELGYSYAITMDSDGQHFARDLDKFLNKLDKNTGALIIGSRNMEQEGIPDKSSFGNRFSNFWYRVETGKKLPDTQSGYRLYPIKALRHIRFFTRKFEFEIEVIVRAAWKGIPVIPVPVEVYYARKEERVSHFRPFWDFTRISILNSILVLYAFLIVKPFAFARSLTKENIKAFIRKNITQNQESNARITAAIMLGVFMGVAPVWGYQMLIALGLAHLLKLNKVIVLVSSNISIPPMIPIILFASFKTGSLFVQTKAINIQYNSNLSFDFIKDHLIQYAIGSLVFGVILALSFGILVYLSLVVFRKKRVTREGISTGK